LTTVADLDSGAKNYSQIAPTSSGQGSDAAPLSTDPLTVIAPISPAPQLEPRVLTPCAPVGGGGGQLCQTQQVELRVPGVPGIDQPAPTSGNRALWFFNRGGL
jgi:hypothetical protein